MHSTRRRRGGDRTGRRRDGRRGRRAGQLRHGCRHTGRECGHCTGRQSGRDEHRRVRCCHAGMFGRRTRRLRSPCRRVAGRRVAGRRGRRMRFRRGGSGRRMRAPTTVVALGDHGGCRGDRDEHRRCGRGDTRRMVLHRPTDMAPVHERHQRRNGAPLIPLVVPDGLTDVPPPLKIIHPVRQVDDQHVAFDPRPDHQRFLYRPNLVPALLHWPAQMVRMTVTGSAPGWMCAMIECSPSGMSMRCARPLRVARFAARSTSR